MADLQPASFDLAPSCDECSGRHDPSYNCSWPAVILICGSRDWRDENMIESVLNDMRRPHRRQTVLHGGARGADGMAGRLAQEMGYDVRAFPAGWKTHGKRAGILRNIQMLDYMPDCVIAFQRNGSRGTQHTINEARKRGIYTAVNESD